MLSLQLFAFGFSSYLVAHLAHIVAWRVRPPRRQLLGLFTWLVALPALGYCVAASASPRDTTDWLAPFFLHLCLAGSYLAIYPAFQATSPSVKILSCLQHASEPLSKEVLLRVLSQESSVDMRIEDLIQSGLLSESDQGYELGRRGKFLARLFRWYRTALCLPRGEG